MAEQIDLTGVARRLLNIEVNTIVRDSMTGEAMPLAPHALLDIGTEYARKLCSLGVDLERYFQADEATHLEALKPTWIVPVPSPFRHELTVSATTFDRLRWAAKWAGNMARSPMITAADKALLERIENNCDMIKEMFKRFRGFEQFIDKTRAQLAQGELQPKTYVIAPDDLSLLQKIWDLGLEQIVAQTIVHVTGDVTTRVQNALLAPGSETLLMIHRRSVDVSVNCWKSLLSVVSEIAGTAIRTLLGGRR